MITVGCNVAENKTTTVSAIVDFGDLNVKRFCKTSKIVSGKKRTNQVVNITQFGDLHSAADFFTGEFRKLMQRKYGNASIGWVTRL